jgi:hypothetical protein
MEKKGRPYIEIKEKENYKKKRVCVPHRVHTVEKELRRLLSKRESKRREESVQILVLPQFCNRATVSPVLA